METGLSYNWHRFYDPATGRYTQPDPLRFVDGPSVYGYAGASPLMQVDPFGMDYVDPMGGYYPDGGDSGSYCGQNFDPSKHPGLVAGMGAGFIGGAGAAIGAEAALAGGAALASEAAGLIADAGSSLGRAGLNAGSKLLGPESPLFKRGGGLLNSNDYFRIGWGWSGNAATGRNVFRIGVGSKRLPFHWHFDIW
jgi:uncharacterized protein RhaS with RHS repeats